MMGQGGQSPILTSSCPSSSVTDLSSRESNAWTLRGHHKSGPHAHRAITGEQEVRGRVSYRGLHIYICRVGVLRPSATIVSIVIVSGRLGRLRKGLPEVRMTNRTSVYVVCWDRHLVQVVEEVVEQNLCWEHGQERQEHKGTGLDTYLKLLMGL